MKVILTETQFRKLFEERVEPSKTAIQNICDSQKFCSAQGKITFGQLRALVESAKKERILKGVGEGSFKALLRLIPWFLPQVALFGFVGSSVRALNKILRPTITETESYKTWWGKTVMRLFNLAEGELNIEDPLSRIFFVSDGLMTMMDDKYKLKFASHIANLASEMSDDQEVPDFFVENELRKWINDKFLLSPPLPPKIASYQDDTENLNVDDQETLKEQKEDKKELFQGLIDEKLEDIKKQCDELSSDTFINQVVGFDTCHDAEVVDSITVNEVNIMTGARTDMYGNMYDATPSIYVKLTINFSSAKPLNDFDNIIYDLKWMLKKSTGELPIVLDYRINNTFTN